MKSFFNRTFENGNHIGEREYGLVFKTTAGVEKKARLMFLSGSAIDEPTTKEPDQKTKEAQKKNFEQLKKENKPVPAPSFSRRGAGARGTQTGSVRFSPAPSWSALAPLHGLQARDAA